MVNSQRRRRRLAKISVPAQGAFKRHFLNAKLTALSPKPVVSIPPDATLEYAVRTMVEHNIGSVVVSRESGGIDGLLSERAIFELAVGKQSLNWRALPAQQLMTRPPISVRALGSIGRALYEMKTNHIRHVLVEPRTDSGDPFGIISMRDILRYVYEVFTHHITGEAASLLDQSVSSDLKQFLHEPVAVLQPHAPITTHAGNTVHAAALQMKRAGVGSILVTDDLNKLTGIFTERDFLIRIASTELDQRKTELAAVMTKSPKTILESGSVALALNLMFEGKFRHLPVLTSSETLEGIVSLRNFLYVLSDLIMGNLLEDQSQK